MFSAKNIFESILSMDCPLVHGLSPVRPWSVHAQVWLETPESCTKAGKLDESGPFGTQLGMWMRMNMPLPGTPGAPLFKGPNVSRFIKVVDGLFSRHFVLPEKEKLDYLADYCSDSISIWLTSLVEFDLGRYEKVVERLKSEYSGQDEMLKSSTFTGFRSIRRFPVMMPVIYMTSFALFILCPRI